MKLSLGFSPCPNDTFIFDALIHQKIDTRGLTFDVHLADVEDLNQRALQNQFNITKLSYHAFSKVYQHYNLLNSGSALGNNCGPLLISKKPILKENLKNCTIAIPGEYTTAHFLLNFYQQETREKKILLFSDIEHAVQTGLVDAGVIIHENRFTYQDKGLQLIQDLGEYWETKTNYPIPLGGIAVQNSLDNELQSTINTLIKQSIEFAFENKDQLPLFIRQHAQEMSEEVMRKHIDLYVNQYSIDLQDYGRNAIQFMMKQLHIKTGINFIQ